MARFLAFGSGGSEGLIIHGRVLVGQPVSKIHALSRSTDHSEVLRRGTVRRLQRFPESRRRVEAAFALLRETKDYPAQKLNPESEVVVALRAQADYESQAGDSASRRKNL